MSSSPNIASVPKTVPRSASGIISLDDIESPVVRRGLDYWRALKGDRTYPSRADMQPRDLAPLLRNVVLLKVVDGGQDYEYRIVGDAHVISHGFSTQGRCVSDVDKFSPGYGAVLKSLYDRVLRKREVFAFRGWLERVVRGKPFIYCESVFMPMGPDEATVDHVLNFSVYTPRDSFEG
ncbi:MAG: PAS domain-containing protein [Rhizomicrobium sp.]